MNLLNIINNIIQTNKKFNQIQSNVKLSGTTRWPKGKRDTYKGLQTDWNLPIRRVSNKKVLNKALLWASSAMKKMKSEHW